MFFRDPDRIILRKIYDVVRGSYNATNANISRMESAIMSMMDDVKAKMDHMDDVVKAVVAVLEQLKTAYDYLKSHPVTKEDPALKDVADKLDAASKTLSDEIAKVNVSGSV